MQISVYRCLSAAPVLAAALICAVPGHAQTAANPDAQMLPPAAVPREEAAAIAQGWVLLAEGKFEEASRAGRAAMSRFPRNVSALALAIEADVAQGGATTALTTYEAWLGSRGTEEPGTLRRVARAFLYEWSRQTGNVQARMAALKALAADEDPHAAAVLASLGEQGKGGVESVERAVERLNATPGLKLREIARLGATGNARAVPPLVAVLGDPQPENRAAAAEALGNLGGQEAVAALKPLLKDPHGVVRIAAAGALFKHGDFSGMPILQELAASEHARMRRSAAMLMASSPDESWKALVRDLLTDSDPSIQLDAARLLLPHDPEAARAVFMRLSTHTDLPIREEAAIAASESDLSDLPTLRRLLRTPVGKAKVAAASRILELTR
jgi:hypothetical protein